MPEPSDYFSEIQSILAELDLDAVLIGALAAVRYRLQPRATTDVDFLARRLEGLAERMTSLGYDVQTMADPGEAPYVMFIRGHGRKVDVLRAETEYQLVAIDRAIDGVLSPEDVIVHKLLAWRPRDRDDVAQILATGIDLDRAYISRWAEEWDVLDRWRVAQG